METLTVCIVGCAAITVAACVRLWLRRGAINETDET